MPTYGDIPGVQAEIWDKTLPLLRAKGIEPMSGVPTIVAMCPVLLVLSEEMLCSGLLKQQVQGAAPVL